jgi:tRNA 2-selenouridine synthase
MAQIFHSLRDLLNNDFDVVIDVRSPAEFAEDHIPGAINLPVLSDDERALVGTIYKQESPFKARKIGGAIIARNTASHLEEKLSDMEGDWKPLIYCWRGGQRSGFFARFLQEVGWRSEVISGGYQSYRRLIHSALYDTPLDAQLLLLDGNTGTAKTKLLELLDEMGLQVIDLEGLANHRGSLLGSLSGGQPTQKAFESELAGRLDGFDFSRPIIVEAESSKIGNINIPPRLWERMCGAPRIEIDAPLPARGQYLVEAYQDILDAPETMRSKLQPLRQFRGHETVDHWETLLDADDRLSLVTSLMELHYDPAYARSRTKHGTEPIARITTNKLDSEALSQTASRIRDLINKPESRLPRS